MTIKDTLKVDGQDAAWRTAGSQFVKMTRDPLVGLLTRHLGHGDSDEARAKIAAFLDTELGKALLAGVLSMALTAMPKTGSAIPERMAKELRIASMAGVGDELADVLMGPLREVISMYLQDGPSGLPAVTVKDVGFVEKVKG